MLTWTPTPSASFYTCGLCGISSQDLVPAYDADGTPLVDADGVQLMVNDEPDASAELDAHIADVHPAG